MTVKYKNYIIDVNDDSNYTLKSGDNIVSYDIEYSDGMANVVGAYPATQLGIRITRNEDEIRSAIICEVGGVTTIHDNSFIIENDNLLICCCGKIYSLGIPDLKLNWTKQYDLATCLGVYHFKDDLIIHGELQITRIDMAGNEKWSFGARDIFVTPDGKEAIEFIEDKIKLTDWDGNEYLLDETGTEV